MLCTVISVSHFSLILSLSCSFDQPRLAASVVENEKKNHGWRYDLKAVLVPDWPDINDGAKRWRQEKPRTDGQQTVGRIRQAQLNAA